MQEIAYIITSVSYIAKGNTHIGIPNENIRNEYRKKKDCVQNRARNQLK